MSDESTNPPEETQSPGRRDFLRGIGVGVGTGVGISSSELKSTETTDLYQEPPEDGTRTFVPLRNGNTVRLEPGEWPVHQFGFETEGAEGKPALETVRSSATYTFHLDGTEVTDFHRGWTGVERTQAGSFAHNWHYPVSPRPPGDHEFHLEIEFPDPIRTPGNPARVWEGQYTFEGTYSVVPESTASARRTQQEQEQEQEQEEEQEQERNRRQRIKRTTTDDLRTVTIDEAEHIGRR